jgi:hypothetical protein
MKKFPKVIRFKINDKETGKPIEKIVLEIRLYANHKNDYYFILPPSNVNGDIVISREWLEEEIKKDKALFIMDYASDLDDCKPKFSLSLLDISALNRAIDAMYLYQEALKISNNEIEKFKQTNNEKYDTKDLDFIADREEMNISIKLNSMT